MLRTKNLAKFKRQSRFSTWLLGIAKNKALQYLRLEIRRRQNSQHYFESAVLNQRLEALQTESTDAEELKIVALRECLSSLPKHARHLIENFYYDQRSTKEIANRESKREGAIRMKLFRIRKKLADCVSLRLKQSDLEFSDEK